MDYPKITIVGAGNVGATAAQLILLGNVADVCLIDIVEGMPQGKALDLMHMRSIMSFAPTITGTNDYADTADSDIVVITAGVARKPGMTREDLIEVNSRIMGSVIEQAVDASPNAVFICVTNPLDIMTYMAYRKSGLPKERLIGMGGVLDSARFAFAISDMTGADINDIHALAVGAHGQSMVCLPRFSTVGDVPITESLSAEQVSALVDRTVNGGAEVVSLLKTGSAFYAPGASIAHMCKAIAGNTGEVLSVSSYLTGEYGINDVYMCVPTRLGRGGVQEIVELPLDEGELGALRDSAASIAAGIDRLGLRG